MEGILEDYYITTGEIARQWNEDGYLTKTGCIWDSDKIVKKFKSILSYIKKEVSQNADDIEDLYRSYNGADGGHFIFFDAVEIMKFKQELENASLKTYMKRLGKAPLRYKDYETNAADTLKCIFQLWDEAGGAWHFTKQEMEVFAKKMENLLPEHRDISEWYAAADMIENEKSYDAYRKLTELHEKDRETLRKCMRQLFIETRKGQLFKKLFSGKHYMRQIADIAEWKEKWTYVMDHMLLLPHDADGKGWDVKDVVRVLLIWYQNEKRRKVVLEKKLFVDLKKAIDSVMREKGKRVKEDLNRKIKQITVEYSEKNYREIMENVNASCKEKVNASCKEEVVGRAMDVISGLAKRKGEFGDELEEDYFNIITQAFDDLEEIAQKEEEKEDAPNKAGRNQQLPKDIAPYVLDCIEIMNPHIERMIMVEVTEREN